MNDIYLWLAAGFGLGWLPVAPGTAGACLGVLLAWIVAHWRLKTQIVVLSILLVLAVWVCDRAALLQADADPANVVLDEIVAFPWAIVGLGLAQRPVWLAVAFIIFRGFDILKPWPVSAAEQLSGGLGIVADDVVAALCTWLILKVFIVFYQPAQR